MKIFFDTNVYVAEAILGQAAQEILQATQSAAWRILSSDYVLDELNRVLVDELQFGSRLASLSCARIRRRSHLIEPGASRHSVAQDPDDSPILQAALAGRADFLVTNDKHLLALDPYEGLRIVSMDEYYQLLLHEGFIGQ
jgi:putative PIN family toxin of toxin-antitoxin system